MAFIILSFIPGIIIFIIFGVFLLKISISGIKSIRETEKEFNSVEATVVDYHYNNGLKSLIIEYTVNGEVYQNINNIYSNIQKPIGSKMNIKYNIYNPNEIVCSSDKLGYYIAFIMGIVMLVSIICSILLYTFIFLNS